jgi:hypothetical protein
MSVGLFSCCCIACPMPGPKPGPPGGPIWAWACGDTGGRSIAGTLVLAVLELARLRVDADCARVD